MQKITQNVGHLHNTIFSVGRQYADGAERRLATEHETELSPNDRHGGKENLGLVLNVALTLQPLSETGSWL